MEGQSKSQAAYRVALNGSHKAGEGAGVNGAGTTEGVARLGGNLARRASIVDRGRGGWWDCENDCQLRSCHTKRDVHKHVSSPGTVNRLIIKTKV